jgi:hypothetical protein
MAGDSSGLPRAIEFERIAVGLGIDPWLGAIAAPSG